jgi:hypothetical protein
VAETTLYNTTWSTFGGRITQWILQNTTNASISGTLTITDAVVPGTHTKALVIAAGGSAFVTSNDGSLGGGALPANRAGSAMFAHTGPPGSIKADTFLIDASGGLTIVPFETAREHQH